MSLTRPNQTFIFAIIPQNIIFRQTRRKVPQKKRRKWKNPHFLINWINSFCTVFYHVCEIWTTLYLAVLANVFFTFFFAPLTIIIKIFLIALKIQRTPLQNTHNHFKIWFSHLEIVRLPFHFHFVFRPAIIIIRHHV